MEMQVSLVSFWTHEYTIQRAHLLSSQNRKPKKKRHNLRQSICAKMGVQPIIRTDAQCAMHLWVNRRIAIRTRKCSLCDSTFCSIRRLHWFSIHWLCHDKAIDFEGNYELLRTKINTFINDTAHRPDRRSQHGELFVNSYDVHNAHESEAISEYFIIRDEIKQNTETTNSYTYNVLPSCCHSDSMKRLAVTQIQPECGRISITQKCMHDSRISPQKLSCRAPSAFCIVVYCKSNRAPSVSRSRATIWIGQHF